MPFLSTNEQTQLHKAMYKSDDRLCGQMLQSLVDRVIARPNGIPLSSDGGTLAVSDYGGTQTWTFRVYPSGVLDAKMATMPMRLAINPKGELRFNEPPPYAETSRGDGMAVDKVGRYYVTSDLSIQTFDPTVEGGSKWRRRERLSITTISPGFKTGARCCSTQARNNGPLMAPSTVIKSPSSTDC